MDSHSIAARPSATTDNKAINHLNDRPCAYAASVSIRAGRPSEAEGKTILPGSETCCDGQPPRIATSRRLLLAGFAALPLAACPAPVPARPAGVCEKLAELIDVARDANAEQARFYSEVYQGHEEREIAARLAGGEPCPIPEDVTSRDNDLCAASTEAETRVMNWPAATPADFHAKIAAMVAFGLFNVADQSRNMLADAARLAGKGA